jgi:hypothetical protein
MPRRDPQPRKPEPEVTFVGRGQVIGEALICRVAEKLNVSEAAVRAWLKSEDKSQRFLEVFQLFGVTPPGKVSPR